MKPQQFWGVVLGVLNVAVLVHQMFSTCLLSDFPSPAVVEADLPYFRDTFAVALGLPAFGNPDLGLDERITLQGSKLFQRFIHRSQFKQCDGAQILSLPPQHKYGYFSQLLGISQSLLNALAHDHVLSWSQFQSFYVDKHRCPNRTFECYFLPITSCDLATTKNITRRENMRNSCAFEFPQRRMHQQPFKRNSTSDWVDVLSLLRRKSGIDKLGRNDLFNPHFFSREALRFITRPNVQLTKLTTQLLNDDFKVSNPWWRPFTFSYSRVSVHIRAGSDKAAFVGVLGPEYYSKLLERLPTREMEVLFTSDSREAHAAFARYLATSTGKQGQFIAQSRFGDLVSLHGDSSLNTSFARVPETDVGMLLMAQCIVFASTDMFVGYGPSNVGATVHLLMGALRHTSRVPYLDPGGSPLATCSDFTEYPLRVIRHVELK
ncbi:hypothetical protein BASA81_005829 [Batrachochytrium salamandrivorans]|nr:hypothetical protein BASA81_005829 [Batrachochytrium salamandrivorans]